ncbi:MAG: HlyC/CorC family transporter [Schwartzia sp.]|nr:HlyC/CorC family transporter [Schwartzia sp. (in: firmicutes)]
MDTLDGLWLIIIPVCLLFSAMLTLSETALQDSSKTSLERLEDEDYKGAKEALYILENPEPILESIQIGLTFFPVVTGISLTLYAAPLMAQYLPLGGYSTELSLLLSLAAATALYLIFGNYLPMKLALQAPEKVLCRHSSNLLYFTRLISPLRTFLVLITDTVLTIFGINPHIDDSVTEDEVKDLLEQGAEDGIIEKNEQTMVERIFHMGDQTAYSLMKPRTQMEWLDLDDDPDDNLAFIRESKEDVFVVGKNSLDEFCGIIYAKDLLDSVLDGKPLDLAALVKKPLLIPRSMEPFRVVEKFRESGMHEGIVLDEFGGVIGYITYQDIIDEITAESAEEDEEGDPLEEIGDHVWQMEGLCSIDDFKERFDLEKLPDEERDHYQTMGGMVTALFGYIPRVGETTTWDEFTFEVMAMDRARIDKIRVTQTIPQPEASPENLNDL